jgi:hypothetical protein
MHRPALIIRIVEPVVGAPVIRVQLRPTADYGAAAPKFTFSSHAVRFATGDLNYRVTTDASLTAVCEERAFALSGALTFILGDDEPVNELPASFGRSLLEQTRQYWEEWVRALAAVGRLAEARELFARLLSRRNSVGLLSEDIDPVTGKLWGYFPQSYSMVGLIISALRLSRYWEDVV